MSWARIIIILVGVVLCGTSCGTFSSRVVSDPSPAIARLQAGGSVEAEVERLAQPLIASGAADGLAIGVLTPDGSRAVYGYGQTGLAEDNRPPRGDTLFQVGSVSKLFVAALLLILVEEGELSMDDTVRGILPPDVRLSEAAGGVTLYELVTHTAGLPREGGYSFTQLRHFLSYLFTGQNLFRHVTKPWLYHYLRRWHPKPGRRGQYLYSNLGYGLLTHLIEVKTGRSFPDLVEEKICRPLNLSNTVYFLDADTQARLAVGHVGAQPHCMPRHTPLAPWEMGEILRGSAGLYSTVDDLLVYAQANMGWLEHPLGPVLSSTRQVQLREPTEDVSFGWLLNYFPEAGCAVTYKHGMISGYNAYIGMNVDERIAVVVLCNTFAWTDQIGHNLVLCLSGGLGSGRRGGGLGNNACPATRAR